MLTLRDHREVEDILEQALVMVDQESTSSERSEEIQTYIDAMELLPQLEKNIGLQNPLPSLPWVTVSEIS